MGGLFFKPILGIGKTLLTGGSTASVTMRQEKAENTTLMVAAVTFVAGVAVTLLIKEIV